MELHLVWSSALFLHLLREETKDMADQIYIDPEMQPALARMKERMASRVPMTSVTPPEMRERARADFAAMNADPPEIALIEDRQLEGAFGPRGVRIYDAIGNRENAPALIYFHGGGWIVGDLDSEEAKLRRLAKSSGIRIISYDYVLAPEYKFPKPLEDCIAAARSARQDAAELGIDPNRLSIGGASAGANLALSTANALRDSGETWLKYLVLFYGVFDVASDAPSREIFKDGFGMGADAMEFFYSLYLNDDSERTDPRASPLRAELAGLPQAFISAAGLDVLRDDSRQLAQKMSAAGIDVTFDERPGVIHGFTLLAHEVSAAQDTLNKAGKALRSVLG